MCRRRRRGGPPRSISGLALFPLGKYDNPRAYLSNAPDIFSSVLLTEAQILVQPKANIIAIEPVSRMTKMQEMLLERYCNGGFAAGGEAGEPKGEALLVTKSAPLLVGHRGGVPCYVTVLISNDEIWRWKGKADPRRHYDCLVQLVPRLEMRTGWIQSKIRLWTLLSQTLTLVLSLL